MHGAEPKALEIIHWSEAGYCHESIDQRARTHFGNEAEIEYRQAPIEMLSHIGFAEAHRGEPTMRCGGALYRRIVEPCEGRGQEWNERATDGALGRDFAKTCHTNRVAQPGGRNAVVRNEIAVQIIEELARIDRTRELRLQFVPINGYSPNRCAGDRADIKLVSAHGDGLRIDFLPAPASARTKRLNDRDDASARLKGGPNLKGQIRRSGGDNERPDLCDPVSDVEPSAFELRPRDAGIDQRNEFGLVDEGSMAEIHKKRSTGRLPEGLLGATPFSASPSGIR